MNIRAGFSEASQCPQFISRPGFFVPFFHATFDLLDRYWLMEVQVAEIVKVGLAVVENDAILLVRKRGSRFYILPGGKPEIGEDDITTLRREIDEELGCCIDPTAVESLGSFVDQAADMPGVKVIVRLYAGRLLGNPTPRAEIDTLAWFRPSDDSEINLAPSLRNSILPFLFRHSPYH